MDKRCGIKCFKNHILQETMSKAIGIIIHDRAPLFSNGIIQNAYFLHQCCEAIGYKCQFLCPEPNPSPFEHNGMSVKQITTDVSIFHPTDYHLVVIVTRDISKEMYDLLKANRVGIVTLVCGNNYMFDQEDFVLGIKSGGANKWLGGSRNIDEQWLIPSFQYALDYMEVIRDRPAFIVPHLWSPEILRAYAPRIIKQPDTALFYNISNRKSKKLAIVLLEPNLNICKTGWLPLVVSERLHMDYPDLIEFVYAFNFPSHAQAYKMIEPFSVRSKIRPFERKTIADLLHFFNNTSECIPIFVTHQVLTHLNYLFYELLYYGYPLVHNSTDLEGCGYKYTDNNIKQCVEQILYAAKHHDKQVETYKAKAKEYLKRVDPLNPVVQKQFDQMIKASIAKHVLSV